MMASIEVSTTKNEIEAFQIIGGSEVSDREMRLHAEKYIDKDAWEIENVSRTFTCNVANDIESVKHKYFDGLVLDIKEGSPSPSFVRGASIGERVITTVCPVIISRERAFTHVKDLHVGCELIFGNFILYNKKTQQIVHERSCRHLIMTQNYQVSYQDLSLANRVVATLISMEHTADMTLFSPKIIIEAIASQRARKSELYLGMIENMAGFASKSIDKYRRFYYYYHLLYAFAKYMEKIQKGPIDQDVEYSNPKLKMTSWKRIVKLWQKASPSISKLADALARNKLSLINEIQEATDRAGEFSNEIDVLQENTWEIELAKALLSNYLTDISESSKKRELERIKNIPQKRMDDFRRD